MPAGDGEVLKADGQLSEDESAALTRTIAALVLNLRGIDPEIRESGLNMLCRLALRRCALCPVQRVQCHCMPSVPRKVLFPTLNSTVHSLGMNS